MIQRVSISVEDVIRAAIHQSAQDFRALRALKGSDINLTYEDFVLTQDDAEAITTEIKNISAQIYESIKGYVCQWYVDVEVCYYIKGEVCSNTVQSIIHNILLYTILAWWFDFRLPDAAVTYREKASIQLSALVGAVVPKFAKRKLRMF